jgi:hypothetical protein
MPREIWNRVLKQASKGFQGYPIATVAYYGPNESKATKVVVAIIPSEDAEADPLERWFGAERDMREDENVTSRILRFIKDNGARSVAAVGKILGCPHEEGKDYPEGEACPMCPYWAGRDRWAGVAHSLDQNPGTLPMRHYRVRLTGSNFWLQIDGSPERRGFYTTRFVEAADPESAEHAAIELLRVEGKLKPLNDPSDPPRIFAEQIEEIRSGDAPAVSPGFAFFTDEDERKN